MLGKCLRFERQDFASFASVVAVNLKSASQGKISGESLLQIPTYCPDFYLFKNKIEFLKAQRETSSTHWKSKHQSD